MYNWFYWFVPFSGNDDLWIKYLTPLIFIAFILGVVAAFVFVFTKTREPNSRKQNRYWWLIYVFSIILTSIVMWVVKNSIENNVESSESFSFDLGGVFTAIAGSWFYVLVTYYIFTNVFRRRPKGNPKRNFPTFVLPHSSKLNSK